MRVTIQRWFDSLFLEIAESADWNIDNNIMKLFKNN